MEYKIILAVILIMILISIQYTLNKIFVELKDIKKLLNKKETKKNEIQLD